MTGRNPWKSILLKIQSPSPTKSYENSVVGNELAIHFDPIMHEFAHFCIIIYFWQGNLHVQVPWVKIILPVLVIMWQSNLIISLSSKYSSKEKTVCLKIFNSFNQDEISILFIATATRQSEWHQVSQVWDKKGDKPYLIHLFLLHKARHCSNGISLKWSFNWLQSKHITIKMSLIG